MKVAKCNLTSQTVKLWRVVNPRMIISTCNRLSLLNVD